MQSRCAVPSSSVSPRDAQQQLWPCEHMRCKPNCGVAGGSCQWCDSHVQRESFGRFGLSKMRTMCLLLVKAESSGVYTVHVLLVVTNLMRVFSLIQNMLWLWRFIFLPLSKLQSGACKTSSPLGHAVFNPGILRYVVWWVSWIFSYAKKST